MKKEKLFLFLSTAFLSATLVGASCSQTSAPETSSQSATESPAEDEQPEQMHDDSNTADDTENHSASEEENQAYYKFHLSTEHPAISSDQKVKLEGTLDVSSVGIPEIRVILEKDNISREKFTPIVDGKFSTEVLLENGAGEYEITFAILPPNGGYQQLGHIHIENAAQ